MRALLAVAIVAALLVLGHRLDWSPVGAFDHLKPTVEQATCSGLIRANGPFFPNGRPDVATRDCDPSQCGLKQSSSTTWPYYHYDRIDFTVTGTGSWTFSLCRALGGGAEVDSMLFLYREEGAIGFVPDQPCFRLVACNDDYCNVTRSQLSADLTPGNYTLVVANWHPWSARDYTYNLKVLYPTGQSFPPCGSPVTPTITPSPTPTLQPSPYPSATDSPAWVPGCDGCPQPADRCSRNEVWGGTPIWWWADEGSFTERVGGAQWQKWLAAWDEVTQTWADAVGVPQAALFHRSDSWFWGVNTIKGHDEESWARDPSLSPSTPASSWCPRYLMCWDRGEACPELEVRELRDLCTMDVNLWKWEWRDDHRLVLTEDGVNQAPKVPVMTHEFGHWLGLSRHPYVLGHMNCGTEDSCGMDLSVMCVEPKERPMDRVLNSQPSSVDEEAVQCLFQCLLYPLMPCTLHECN